MNTLSSQPENQITAGETAEEADLLRRSKKKTKRNLADRENDPMEMEEGEYDTSATTMGSPEETSEEAGGAPANTTDPTAETREGPIWKVSDDIAENRQQRRPLGDKYGSWMIAMRKPRTYQNKTDPRRNNARNSGGKNDSSKGKTGTNHGGSARNFNKEGFTIWNNQGTGLWRIWKMTPRRRPKKNPEKRKGRKAQRELFFQRKAKGPKLRSQKPKYLMTNQCRTERTQRANQAAETESHTVVRGYENGKRVETTRIDEEGSAIETSHPQADTGDHHNDPPDPSGLTDTGEAEDPMVDVEFTGNQSLRGHEGESS
nr:uncharacterized protein LOC109158743 [Ipomoea batatas]GME10160.1 uncharacterized protein LOC109158743 [Ipomoea batatas]